MKKNLIIMLAATIGFMVNRNYAQVSSYNFNQFAGSYESINTGTMAGSNIQDDVINQISLPFTFTFNGSPYKLIPIITML